MSKPLAIVRGVVAVLLALLFAFLTIIGQDVDPFSAAATPPVTITAPPVCIPVCTTTTTSTTTTSPPPTVPEVTLMIDAAADAAAVAVRVSPPRTEASVAMLTEPTGLFGMPFAPPGLSECEEMVWYLNQQSAPTWMGDQPRTGPATQRGLGWRESNCKNYVENCSTGRCYSDWFQIGAGNITADGYAASGLWDWCGITRKSDYFGHHPLQKQKSVCAAIGLNLYHESRGENGRWAVWDRWL